ncbi:hypothetical protein QOT17_023565 [Balamuthia mandrillaris]
MKGGGYILTSLHKLDRIFAATREAPKLGKYYLPGGNSVERRMQPSRYRVYRKERANFQRWLSFDARMSHMNTSKQVDGFIVRPDMVPVKYPSWRRR